MSPPSTSRPAMLTIGLVGGMSWESSAHYYRLLNERVRERLEQHGLTVFPTTRLRVESALDAAFAVPAVSP